MNLLTNLNLNRNELQNAVIHPLTQAPATAKEGQIYYNSNDDKFYFYNGSQWKQIGVSYEQVNSNDTVITGLTETGTVQTTDVADLVIKTIENEDYTISDVVEDVATAIEDAKNAQDAADNAQADATQALSDAAAAKSAAEAAQSDVDNLEQTVAGLSSAVAGGIKFVAASELPDLASMSDEEWNAITNGTIYLITKNPAGANPNTKDEYLYIKGETKTTSTFELIGDTAPSLEGYLKTEDLEDELSNIDVSDATVSVPAPTEDNPSATEDKKLSEIIAEQQEAIKNAQDAADDAQSAVDALKPNDFIKTATGTLQSQALTKTVSMTIPEGKTAVVMSVLTTDGDNVVYTDAKINATNVVFTIADKYESDITCKVFYYIV